MPDSWGFVAHIFAALQKHTIELIRGTRQGLSQCQSHLVKHSLKISQTAETNLSIVLNAFAGSNLAHN